MLTEAAIKHYINEHPVSHFREKLIKGGGFEKILRHAGPRLDRLFGHIQKLPMMSKDSIQKVYNKYMGGSGGMGGSAGSGGSLHVGGSIFPHLANAQNHKEMYHGILNMNPHEFEFMREAASQMLGAKPSGMWDDLGVKGGSLESDPEQYEHIIRMPNNHAMARLIEAEHGPGKGAGFWKAVKHVAKKAGNVYHWGRGVLKTVTKNKDLFLENPWLKDYAPEISAFLDTANELDDAINPIIEATIDATKENATDADRQKLKKMAEQSIEKVVDKHIPQAKDLYKLAVDVRDTVKQIPVNAR